MFKSAGFLSQTTESHIHSFVDGSVTPVESLYANTFHTEAPPGSLTVFRGDSLESRGRGMSWTSYRECAASFAEDGRASVGIRAGIFRAVIPSRAVLAIFGDSREQEIVVNPHMLRGRIERVETVEPDWDEIERQRRDFARVFHLEEG